MKIVQRVETFDGKLHIDRAAARQYLSRLHCEVLSKISIDLCKCDAKHVATGNWVDENLQRFLDLHAIKKDMNVDSDDEEDDAL